MRGSHASSEPVRGGAIALVAVAILGCAGPRRTVPLPPAEADLTEPRPAPAGGVEIPLPPGAERLYPSEDPRNAPVPGQGEAFPPPSGAVPPPRPAASAPSPSAPPAARSAPPAAAPARAGARSGRSTFLVQVFASGSHETAGRRAEALSARFDRPVVIEEERGLFKVRIEAPGGRESAEELRRRAVELGFRDAFVIERSVVDGGPQEAKEQP